MCQIYKELIALIGFYQLDTNRSHLRRQNLYEELLPSKYPVGMSLEPCEMCYPWASGPWFYTKDSFSSYELTKKECSSVVYASGSAHGLLPQVLALAFQQ